MVTTIQINEQTLLLLKKIKAVLEASSYDETINKMAIKHMKPKKSMAGSLKKYLKGQSIDSLLKELQNERRTGWN